MLNKRTQDFAMIVLDAAALVGNNSRRVTDHIMRDTFPNTVAEAEMEGADKMLRSGVIEAVEKILKKQRTPAEQMGFNSIAPALMPIVDTLKSSKYRVEALDELVPIHVLIQNPELLDDARKHMRRKGMECLDEAKSLDELYAAVTASEITA